VDVTVSSHAKSVKESPQELRDDSVRAYEAAFFLLGIPLLDLSHNQSHPRNFEKHKQTIVRRKLTHSQATESVYTPIGINANKKSYCFCHYMFEAPSRTSENKKSHSAKTRAGTSGTDEQNSFSQRGSLEIPSNTHSH
jgi:hypothetical protein